MRTFVALELPREFADDVAGVARRLGPVVGGRLTDRRNYHLTLAFLGEIGEADARLAIEALEGACADAAAPLLACDGLGTFGKRDNATLWLGIRPSPELTTLASAVREGLRARGVAFDDKPFRPHVTLARHARLPRGPLPDLAFPLPARPERVTLYRSILEPEGARYKPLFSARLG